MQQFSLLCFAYSRAVALTLRKQKLKRNTKNEISTCSLPRSVPRTTPNDQNHPRGPWNPPRHPETAFCVFGASRALPEEPPGPPRDPPRDPQGLPRDGGDPPKNSQGPPRDLPGPPEGTPESQRNSSEPAREAKGHPRPSQAGPAECAKRLNRPSEMLEIHNLL